MRSCAIPTSRSSRSPATNNGKLIARNAADTLKRVHLESCKAPMVVLDDADPATVAEAVKIGGYWNSGQDCTASSRILVSDKVYEDVLGATKDVIEAMKTADPADGDDVDMGPVISAEQRERVLGFLARLPSRATVVTGGEAVGDRGFFVKPTIVADVEQGDEIVQDGIAPVVTIQRFASDDEAVEMANGVRYGLAASVFSENVGRALAAAKRLDFGTVWINEHLFPLASEMPARRLQAVRLRQGHEPVFDGGVHAHQARRGKARRGLSPTSGPAVLQAAARQPPCWGLSRAVG